MGEANEKKKKAITWKTIKCGTNNHSFKYFFLLILVTKSFIKKFLCGISVYKVGNEGFLWSMQSYLQPQGNHQAQGTVKRPWSV